MTSQSWSEQTLFFFLGHVPAKACAPINAFVLSSGRAAFLSLFSPSAHLNFISALFLGTIAIPSFAVQIVGTQVPVLETLQSFQ